MRFNFASIDKFLLISVIALLLFGLIVIATASFGIAQERFNDAFFYLKRQLLIGSTFGLGFFLFAFLVPYRWWRKAALFLFLLNIILLIAVFFPPFGVKLKGSSRWLQVYGGYTVQPSELLKITLVLYLAALFEKRHWQASSFKRGFIPFLTVLILSAALVGAEPDITTAAIIAGTATIVYLCAGAKPVHFLMLIILVLAGFLTMIFFAPHSAARLKAFLNKEGDISGSGYHSYQIRNTIISGGLYGTAFERNAEKYRFLPEPFSDSIFAVAAKEFGFIGASLIILAFILFSARGIIIAYQIPDLFGRLVMAGLVSSICLQALVNISAMVGLLPIAGIPLPFLSYGGSALIANLFSTGLILNISRYQK